MGKSKQKGGQKQPRHGGTSATVAPQPTPHSAAKVEQSPVSALPSQPPSPLSSSAIQAPAQKQQQQPQQNKQSQPQQQTPQPQQTPRAAPQTQVPSSSVNNNNEKPYRTASAPPEVGENKTPKTTPLYKPMSSRSPHPPPQQQHLHYGAMQLQPPYYAAWESYQAPLIAHQSYPMHGGAHHPYPVHGSAHQPYQATIAGQNSPNSPSMQVKLAKPSTVIMINPQTNMSYTPEELAAEKQRKKTSLSESVKMPEKKGVEMKRPDEVETKPPSQPPSQPQPVIEKVQPEIAVTTTAANIPSQQPLDNPVPTVEAVGHTQGTLIEPSVKQEEQLEDVMIKNDPALQKEKEQPAETPINVIETPTNVIETVLTAENVVGSTEDYQDKELVISEAALTQQPSNEEPTTMSSSAERGNLMASTKPSGSGKKQYDRDFLLSFKDKFYDKPSVPRDLDISSPVSPKIKGGRIGYIHDRKKHQQSPRTPLVRKKQKWAEKIENDPNGLIYAEVTNILNKLAPEKYDTLVQHFLRDVKVPNSDVLEGIVSLIFEKAVFEPKFSNIYADLCNDLSEKLQKDAGVNEKTFRKILLNKCQEEFEDKVDEATTDEQKDALAAQRKRTIGTIIFIGELFKKKLLSEKIMHTVVIQKLLMDQEIPDESNLEVLCRLLGTVGEPLDTKKANDHMDIYFEKIKRLQQEMRLSARIRFMLLDTIELRQEKWVPRLKQEKAKKIGEIKRDIEREKIEKKMEIEKLSNKSGARVTSNGRATSYDSRVGRSNRNSRYQHGRNAPDDQRGPKQHNDKPHKLYGSTKRSENQGSSGSRGWSNSKDYSSPSSKEKPVQANQNPFEALASVETHNDDDEEEGDSRKIVDEEEGDGGKAIDDDEGDNSKTADEVDLTEAGIENAIKMLVGDLMEQEETSEAISDVRKLLGGDHKIILKTLIVESAKKTEGQHRITKLFDTICKEGLFSKQNFLDACKLVFDFAMEKELHMDSPAQFKNIADLNGRLVSLKVFECKDIVPLIQSNILGALSSGSYCVEFVTSFYSGWNNQLLAESNNTTRVTTEDFGQCKLNILKSISVDKIGVVEKYCKLMKQASLDKIEPIAYVMSTVISQEPVDDLLSFVSQHLRVLQTVPERVLGALLVAVEATTTFARKKANDVDHINKYAKLVTLMNNKQVFLSEARRIADSTKNEDIYPNMSNWVLSIEGHTL